MEGANVIQTKRRYSFIKNIILELALYAEFFLVFGKAMDYKVDKNFILVFAGYALVVFFFLIRGYGRNVYLKYEAGLSLIIKNIVINLIMSLFILALDIWDGKIFAWYMLVFTGMNIVSSMLINFIGNIFLSYSYKKADTVIYIVGDSERYRPGDDEDCCDRVYISELEDLSKIEELIKDYKIVYLMDVSSEQRNEILKTCYAKRKTVYFTSKLSDILVKAAALAQDGDTPVYYSKRFGAGGPSAVAKRVFDVVCSGLALVVLLPMLLLVALIIKLQDKGPVFYTQTRCTINCKEFKIYKFRSMKVDSEGGKARLASVDDDRITPFGKFLRNSKIDELPQLINILKGDMSIVGPRPERPELVAETIKEVPEFILRMNVKAGLTGYAQVRGGYNTDFLDKLKWDLMYVENYSFLLDIKIILLTVFAIIDINRKKKD